MATDNNRLILSEMQVPKKINAGDEISFAGRHGNYGYSRKKAETEMVEVKVETESGESVVYITRPLFDRIRSAFHRKG